MFTPICIEQTVMSVEEDSEPILGLWFKEILTLSDEISRNANKETNNEASAGHIAGRARQSRASCKFSNIIISLYTYYNHKLLQGN